MFVCFAQNGISCLKYSNNSQSWHLERMRTFSQKLGIYGTLKNQTCLTVIMLLCTLRLKGIKYITKQIYSQDSCKKHETYLKQESIWIISTVNRFNYHSRKPVWSSYIPAIAGHLLTCLKTGYYINQEICFKQETIWISKPAWNQESIWISKHLLKAGLVFPDRTSRPTAIERFKSSGSWSAKRVSTRPDRPFSRKSKRCFSSRLDPPMILPIKDRVTKWQIKLQFQGILRPNYFHTMSSTNQTWKWYQIELLNIFCHCIEPNQTKSKSISQCIRLNLS